MGKLFAKTLAIVISLGITPLTFAQWSVNSEKSILSFVTVKAEHVAEVHTFDQISGQVSENGEVKVEVNLASVNTMVPIRNERMQAMLFETNLFPSATITAQVDVDKLGGMTVGDIESSSLDFELSLHGNRQSYTAEVLIARMQNGVAVSTRKPIIVSADSFGLAGGVEALREVAGLPSISKAVPVSFQLVID
ncbi:MAG: YceI family protein [Pseudohongiellaceae bacterium]